MSYNDQQIRDILMGYTRDGRKQQSWGVIDPDNWDPLHGGSTDGNSPVSYYYMECAHASSRWKLKGKEAVDGHGRYPVMYKRKFKFIPRGRNGPRTWVMTEYTLHPNMSDKNKKAICAIQDEGSSSQ